jgi:hypothetical protein
MRNHLKSYFKFWGLAFKEEFSPVWRYKPVRIFYLIIGIFIAEVLDLIFGIPIWQWVKPIFALLSYQ